MHGHLILAAALMLPPAAAGAATQGTIPVDPNGGVSGAFSAAGTQTWVINLKRGQTYATWGYDNAVQEVAVRAAGGRVLAQFEINGGGDLPDGVSFQAPYTGSYTVVVTQPASCWGATPCVGPGGQGDGGYNLAAAKDCPGDVSTRCAIAVGHTLADQQMRYITDSDWFRTGLRAGVTYLVTIGAGADCGNGARATIRDARGAVLARGEWYSCDATPAIVYTAPRSGTYYVEVIGGGVDPLSTYSLTLSR